MAANLIISDPTKELCRQRNRAITLIREGMLLLEQVRAHHLQARDGDGTQAAHYDLVSTVGGFSAGDYADGNAAAQASFNEIDSLYSKVCTDNAVSSVRAAILQACAKHGV